MSYEDLKEVRARRVKKEKATAGKGKRGPKRKSPAPEAEAQAGSPKVVTNPSMTKDKMVRVNEVEPSKTVGAPFRAPVPRMI